MTKIMEILGLLAGLVPLVLTLIKQFETPGFGAEKKQAVLDAIALIYDQLNITVITKEKLLAIVGNIIDIAVGLFNVVGIFKKGEVNPT
jgi:hypothetical protein